MKSVFIKSYGCQMNVYDAQRMADVLAGQGYEETTVIEDADVVVLNTCNIRERPPRRSTPSLAACGPSKPSGRRPDAIPESWLRVASPRQKGAR